MGNVLMGKILRVNLSKGSISEEDIPQDWLRDYLGVVGWQPGISTPKHRETLTL